MKDMASIRKTRPFCADLAEGGKRKFYQHAMVRRRLALMCVGKTVVVERSRRDPTRAILDFVRSGVEVCLAAGLWFAIDTFNHGSN